MNVYEFQVGDNGQILNGAVATSFVDITGVSGLDNAPYRQATRAREGLDGSFIDADFETERTVVISGTVFGDESYLDQLKDDFAPSRKSIPFYFVDELNRQRVLFVKPMGLKYDWNSLKRLGQTDFQGTLIAGDPTIYSASLKSVPMSLPGNLTGRAYNRQYNYGYGGYAGSPLTQVTNNGNRPTWPTFTIYGDCTNPKISNEDTGEFIKLARSIGSNGFVVIDTQNRIILLNGTDSIRGDMTADSSWFDLNSGNTVLRYTASVIGASSVAVDYRDAWR